MVSYEAKLAWRNYVKFLLTITAIVSAIGLYMSIYYIRLDLLTHAIFTKLIMIDINPNQGINPENRLNLLLLTGTISSILSIFMLVLGVDVSGSDHPGDSELPDDDPTTETDNKIEAELVEHQNADPSLKCKKIFNVALASVMLVQ